MKAKLGYWKIRGLAAPIRMLLHYCDVPFEDVRHEQGGPPDFSGADWLEKKFTLGLAIPNVPYYIDDRGRLTQSLAIMRYVAARHGSREGGLGYDTPHVDMIANAAMDLRNAFAACSYGSRTMDDVESAVALQIRPQLQIWEAHISGCPAFCAGERLSFADFFLAEHIEQIRLVLPRAVDGCPALLAYAERFFALDKIQAFMRTPYYMHRPVNNKVAIVGNELDD
jgi:glutathione S-transferase